jgi:hypothetical protein
MINQKHIWQWQMERYFTKIITIAKSGRRVENLNALLKSYTGIEEIVCADRYSEIAGILKPEQPVLVVFDHISCDTIHLDIRSLRQLDSAARILLLVAHPQDAFPSGTERPDAVLCDGFSTASLFNEIDRLTRH